jgi:hypothetical protein
MAPKRHRIFEPDLIKVLEQDISPFLVFLQLLLKKASLGCFF